jgi:dihydroorotase
LYFNNNNGILANYPEFLETLFSRTDSLVALHCEDDEIIENNLSYYTNLYGENIPFELHPLIRSEEACLTASKRVLEIAKKHNTRLHLLHISTLAEANLFDNTIAIRDKRITAEACIHHLWFSDEDYPALGAKIKWNPAIKTLKDKTGLLTALIDNRLDNIATDHAPHTIYEKIDTYFNSLSGGPLVQHSLVVMLELFHQGKITIEKIVEKMSHNVAEIYRIKERGYIREGYYADLVLVDLECEWTVSAANTLYKCQWSPLNNQSFQSDIRKTFVNGHLVYDDGVFYENNKGCRLKFEKYR